MAGKAEFQDLVVDGGLISVRVTPKASRNAVQRGAAEGADLRVSVTVVPENGKATAAAIKVMARALGIPKSRLQLVRGATSRDKVFRID